jgi:hypothetical protein
MVNNFLKLKKKYLSIFNIDFRVEKNWLTINFLKILYYISIWIVIFYIYLIDRTFTNYNIHSDLYTIWKDIYVLNNYLSTVLDPVEIKRLAPLVEISNMQEEILVDCLYEVANWETINGDPVIYSDILILSYDIPIICLKIFRLLMFMWLLLIGSFLLIHISYGLYQVYNDYIRDLNVLLQKYLTVLSVLILLNILFLFYNNVNIYNDVLLNTTIYLYIYKFSLLYIFLFLFINYIVNKDKKIVLNYLYYLICSIICFILSLVVIWYLISYVLFNFDLSAWFLKSPIYYKIFGYYPYPVEQDIFSNMFYCLDMFTILAINMKPFIIYCIPFVLLIPSAGVYLFHQQLYWAYDIGYSIYSIYTVCIEEKIMLIIYNFFL